MECLRSPGGGSKFHLSPFECQSICYPQKTTSSVLVQKHSDAVKDKVMKLKQSRAIKEVFYPEWLANTIVVRKKNGK